MGERRVLKSRARGYFAKEGVTLQGGVWRRGAKLRVPPVQYQSLTLDFQREICG